MSPAVVTFHCQVEQVLPSGDRKRRSIKRRVSLANVQTGNIVLTK